MGNHKEMTRYAFISHMEDYMKQLLKDPLHADTDEFLKYHGFNGPKALSLLLKRPIIDDKNSAILIKTVGIKDNGVDEDGNRLKDSFTVKYHIPRKDYTKKMRNLYIKLFENNIIESTPLNEGAWGYGILDNDSALDKQTEFCKNSLRVLYTNLNMSVNSDDKWANLGVLVDFIKKYNDDEIKCTDEYNIAIELCVKVTNELFDDEAFIASWSNQSKIKSEIKRIYRDVISNMYDRNRLNEDGEGGGATSADASGQFTQPLFGKPIKRKPIKRKTMYITQEQEAYIKKMIEEEAVMNTQAGNFGFDAPIGDGKKNKNNKFFAAANDHKDIMKKSWQNEE